jgi:SEC-C motif domain protein
MAKTAASEACPCGGAAGYEACCGRWHEGALRLMAPTAEALMRSRYSAHALGLHAYLQDTWHPRTRPVSAPGRSEALTHRSAQRGGFPVSPAPPPPGLRWIGLEVRRVTAIDDEHAAVEFVARSKIGGRAERMHVVSRFERVSGRWLYVEDDDAP